MNELDIQRHRVDRLKAAVDRLTGGNVTEFARRLGYADGAFIRQMLTSRRPVSEKTVRAIEAIPGMKRWFDSTSDSYGTTPDVPALLVRESDAEPTLQTRYAHATPAVRALVDLALRMPHEPPPDWASPAMVEVLKGAVALAGSLHGHTKSHRAKAG